MFKKSEEPFNYDKNKSYIVFYHHPCLDGSSACKAIYDNSNSDSIFIGMPPCSRKIDPEIVKNRNVLFLDLCPEEKELEMLKQLGATVGCIDHHPNAHNVGCCKYYDDSVCATVLTYKVLGIQPPRYVTEWINPHDTGKLLENYEWDKLFALDYFWDNYFTGIGSLCLLDDPDMEKMIINKGKEKTTEIILKYESYMESADVSDWNGWKLANFCCTDSKERINKGYLATYIARYKNNVDIACVWEWKPKQNIHTSSWRTVRNNIDLNILLKPYGGGGHCKAAGLCFKDKEEVFSSNPIIYSSHQSQLLDSAYPSFNS